MKIYFMKQSALDYIKQNIGSLYKNYYQFDSDEWIYELFDYDPFEVFGEVDDFELANLDQSAGEVDLQNCKILYDKLNHISDSKASDIVSSNRWQFILTRFPGHCKALPIRDLHLPVRRSGRQS